MSNTRKRVVVCVACLALSLSTPPVFAEEFTLDVDADGKTEPLTDGLLIIRHLFEFEGDTLTSSAVGSDATRSNPQELKDHLNTYSKKLDIDDDGTVQPLTDGLLIIRSLFDFSEEALISNAVANTGSRNTANAIETYLQSIKDTDGDGVVDSLDAFATDPTETLDTNSDGVGNNTDTDDDGDGILDASDAFPLNHRPSFTSTVDLSAVEHETGVATIEINDANLDDTLSMEISGGVDQELFQLGACNTSRCTAKDLIFRTAPDFEDPTDFDQDNKYRIIISATDGKEAVTQEVNISVTNYVFYEDGKKELHSVDWNAPSNNEIEDVCITGLDVPVSHESFCEEVYALLRSTLGGYPNYLHVIWNENGTDADAKPVLDKLTTIVGEEQRLEDLKQCCLCGKKDWSEESNLSSYHGVCFLPLGFTSNPFDAGWSDFDRHGQLALVYAHEYFHHYQLAHMLERTPYFAPNNAPYIEDPAWYSEGTAVAFQSAWLKTYFSSLEVYSDSAQSDIAAVGRTLNDSRSFKEIPRTLMGADGEKNQNCSSDWAMTELEEDGATWGECDAKMLVPSYLAYLTSWETVLVDIPKIYYDLGFWGAVYSLTGLSKTELYSDFNEFMRSGDAEDEPPLGWELTPEIFLALDFLNIDYERL